MNGLEMIINFLETQPNELADILTTLLEEIVRYENLALPLLHAGVIKMYVLYSFKITIYVDY